MKYILIILFINTFLNADLQKSLNFVFDSENEMQWQDNQNNIALQLSHKDAILYCKNLKLGGKLNWRLATRDDYEYIIDKSRKDEHQINRAFKYSMPLDYWTSDTTWRSFGKYAYYVFLKSGTIYYQNKTYKKLVRCVR